MRDKRAIIIKTPSLRRIRNNLRSILLEVYHIQWKKIHDEWRSYLFNSDGSRRSIESLSPDELKRFRLLQQEENQLTDVINRSICVCVACGKGDRDMVYNKAYDAWYCTECYGLHHAHAKKLAKKAKEGAKPHGHEEKAIDELYKTFL